MDRRDGAGDDRFHRVIRLPEAGTTSDSTASYDLAVCAHRFTTNARRVVDDKLSLSATLMRAGEVDEAKRLLIEAERDFRNEEAALIEHINELKMARSMDANVVPFEAHPVTRKSLARLMAVAMISSSLFAFSAVGFAAAGFFRPDGAVSDSTTQNLPATALPTSLRSPSTEAANRQSSLVPVMVGGKRIMVSSTDAAKIEAMREAGKSDDDLLLALNAGVTVSDAVSTASKAVDDATSAVEAAKDDVTGDDGGGGQTSGDAGGSGSSNTDSGSGDSNDSSSGSGSGTSTSEEPPPSSSEEPPPTGTTGLPPITDGGTGTGSSDASVAQGSGS